MCPAKFEALSSYSFDRGWHVCNCEICDIVSRTVITLSSQDEMSSHFVVKIVFIHLV